jgi:serine/threonine protein phosphatase 1
VIEKQANCLRMMRVNTYEEPVPTLPLRLIAIGDIHGHVRALRGVLELIKPTSADTIITLGDVVNRGPDSRAVIETLLELGNVCSLIAILGNHEEMMLDARNPRLEERWRNMGGWETLMSYGSDGLICNVPDTHWRFLKSCRPYYEVEGYIFTHANYDARLLMQAQPGELLRWVSIEEEKPEPHRSGNIVILGHTPGLIRDLGFCRCIDTGCGFGGCLTAMEVNMGQCWQVDEGGTEIRRT